MRSKKGHVASGPIKPAGSTGTSKPELFSGKLHDHLCCARRRSDTRSFSSHTRPASLALWGQAVQDDRRELFASHRLSLIWCSVVWTECLPPEDYCANHVDRSPWDLFPWTSNLNTSLCLEATLGPFQYRLPAVPTQGSYCLS